MTGAQAYSPVKALELGHFSIGGGGGVTVTNIDKGSIKNLSLNKDVDTDFVDDFPSYLPIPMPLLNAHVGLPGFLFFESTSVAHANAKSGFPFRESSSCTGTSQVCW